MYFTALLLALVPLTTIATNVVLSNDDGWAEINIRVFYDTLVAAGDSVVLSAPAENESGTGTRTPSPRSTTFISLNGSKNVETE